MNNSIYVFYWSHWGPQRKCTVIVKQLFTKSRDMIFEEMSWFQEILEVNFCPVQKNRKIHFSGNFKVFLGNLWPNWITPLKRISHIKLELENYRPKDYSSPLGFCSKEGFKDSRNLFQYHYIKYHYIQC